MAQGSDESAMEVRGFGRNSNCKVQSPVGCNVNMALG